MEGRIGRWRILAIDRISLGQYERERRRCHLLLNLTSQVAVDGLVIERCGRETPWVIWIIWIESVGNYFGSDIVVKCAESFDYWDHLKMASGEGYK